MRTGRSLFLRLLRHCRSRPCTLRPWLFPDSRGQDARVGQSTDGFTQQGRTFVWLKDLGGLRTLDPAKPDSAYLPGDRVGIFTLISNTPNEVLLGDSDKHLDVVLSIYKHRPGQAGDCSIVVTTVVHNHNLLGKMYMLPVTPLHKLIAPAVLSRVIC